MSYSPLGFTLSEAIRMGTKVMNDPHLSEFACEANRFDNVDKGKPAGGTCPRVTSTSARRAQGIGLSHMVGPLRLYTWHKQNTWALPLAIAGIFGLTFAIGFKTGKRKRK